MNFYINLKERTMISLRLQNLVKLIEKGSCVADIGSDHGYLLLELKKLNLATKMLGVENKKGPFEHLKKNVLRMDPELKNINISFSSGLEEVTSEYTTVVIAGMGFVTIKSIIEKDLKKTDFINTFIIDSHSNTPELRHFLNDIGYYIDKELCFYDKKVFYEVIRFKKGHKVYNDLDYKFGPYLRVEKNEDYERYYGDKINKIDIILSNGKLSDEIRDNLIKEKEELKKIL